MKKIVSVLLSVIIMLSLSAPAFAVDSVNNENTVVEYFEDGSCFITTITVVEENSTYATNTKTFTKTISYKDEDGIVCWKATLTATFRYTGSSATCTESDVTYTVSNSKWKITSATASKSGNTATADVTAKRYTLGIPVETLNRTITMTCSANGTVS